VCDDVWTAEEQLDMNAMRCDLFRPVTQITLPERRLGQAFGSAGNLDS
jgi:hypothetical protein